MSLLALSLSVLGVTASLGVAVWAWHAMKRLDDDDLRTYAGFELMVAPPPPARAGRGLPNDLR